MRTVLDVTRNESGLVDRYIGTAFDIVRKVHDNLDVIKQTSYYMEPLVNAGNNAEAIKAINAVLPELHELYSSLDTLEKLAKEINDDVKIASDAATTATSAITISKDWAVSDDLVSGTDYSSKYYAGKSKDSENISYTHSVEAKSSADAAKVSETNAKSSEDKAKEYSDAITDHKYVSSFAGREGIVIPTKGDYTVDLITGSAPLDSPAFTGTPTAPTVDATDSSTKLATTAFVSSLFSTMPSNDVLVYSGTDLNSITTNSRYYVSDASKVANSPCTGAYFVETTTASGLFKQLVTTYLLVSGVTVPYLYVRFNAAGGYSAWTLVPTGAQLNADWVNITPNNQWGSTTNYSRYRKNIFTTDLHISCDGTGDADETIFTLPNEACPRITVAVPVRTFNKNPSSGVVPSIVVFPDGRVATRNCSQFINVFLSYDHV